MHSPGCLWRLSTFGLAAFVSFANVARVVAAAQGLQARNLLLEKDLRAIVERAARQPFWQAKN